MKKALLLALLVVAAAPAAAQAAMPKRPPVRYVRGDGSYTKASRAFGTINRLVVHATDGGSMWRRCSTLGTTRMETAQRRLLISLCQCCRCSTHKAADDNLWRRC